MPTIIRCGGGIPVSDFESLQAEYNSYKSSHSYTNDEYTSYKSSHSYTNDEYTSYKSSHSYTNDEYTSYGTSQYNAGMNDGKSKLSVVRFDGYGWGNSSSNVIDTGGTSTKTIYFAAAFKTEFSDSTARMYAQGSNDNSSWNNIVSKGPGGAGNSWEGKTSYRYFRLYYQGKYGGDSSAGMLAVKA